MRTTPLLAALLAGALAARPGATQTLDQRIDRLLGGMSLEQRISQITQDTVWSTAEDPALAIPGFNVSDGPHGVTREPATSFPVDVALAATWDEELVGRVARAIGEEMRARGHNQALGPCIDLVRDPRAGRVADSLGEDPYLAARLAVAYVLGLQSTSCIATPKHFLLNTREFGRSVNDYAADDRTLIEHYGAPFRAVVEHAQAWSLMSAYNLVNGAECSESSDLLYGVLRARWGHHFSTISDWGGVTDAGRAIRAGTDLETGSSHYRQDLEALLRSGEVPVAALDTAVRRVLRTKLASGLLGGQPLPDFNRLDSTAHRALAREAAQAAIVLLANPRALLPLDPGALSSIAVVGPSADLAQLDAGGSSNVRPFHAVTPLQGITSRVGPGVTINHSRGSAIAGSDRSGYAAAVAAAAAADVAIFVGGLDRTLEGEDCDRVGDTIALPAVQCDLIRALAAVSSNLVVVLEGGGAIASADCVASAAAVVYAFYPGQEGGDAIADVLFGAVNPGGKLPYTIPRHDADLPVWGLDHRQDLIEGRGYRWFDGQGIEPEYPFGHGLSYTTFAYAGLTLDPAAAPLGAPIEVGFTVANAGLVAGDEVVQVYLAEPDCSLPVAPRQLKKFRRVHLAPGARASLSFTLDAEDFYHFNPATGEFQAEPGRFPIAVGSSSRDLRLFGEIVVAPAPAMPDLVATGVAWVPAHPRVGDRVRFRETLKNRGTGPTPEGVVHEVAFSIRGTRVALSSSHDRSIAPGEAVTVEANSGAGGSGGDWVPAATGTYSVAAEVDPSNRIFETLEGNNYRAAVVTVAERNLAAYRPVTVSGSAFPWSDGSRAVDQAIATGWFSGQVDPQTLAVDLGSRHALGHVGIAWGEYPARAYAVEVSDDGTAWLEVLRETAGDGGIDDLAVAGSGRFVRLVLLARDPSPFYALTELEVFGQQLAPPMPEAGHCADGADNDGNGRVDCADPACIGPGAGAGTGEECPALAYDRRVAILPGGATPAIASQFDPACSYGGFHFCPEGQLAAPGTTLVLAGAARPAPAGAAGLHLYEHSTATRLRLARTGGDLTLGWD